MDENLSLSLVNSLSEDASSILSSALEVGIDAITEDGVLKDIPIISTAISIYKIGHNIHERMYLKKLASFVSSLNNAVVDEKAREHYKKRIESNSITSNKELEYILIIIDRYLHIDKARALANFYLAYLDGLISWNDFAKCSEVLDRMLPGDYEELKKQNWIDVEDRMASDSLLRLVSLGIVYFSSKEVSTQNTIGTITIPALTKKDYALTTFGTLFLKHLIK